MRRAGTGPVTVTVTGTVAGTATGTVAVAVAVAAAITAAGCGPEVPAPGTPAAARAARVARRVEPADLFPADLDLVVRVDVARMRAGLGPAAADELAERALSGEGDAALREAARRADVAWRALRLADLDEGDRVVAFEGRMRGVARDPGAWQPLPVDVGGVSVFERRGRAPRAGAQRMIALGDRAIAFVSPAEASSVARVLRDGPDARRGDPAAEGLVSLDLRARRLPPRLERRFPSIAAIIGGLERVRAVAALAEDGIHIEADVIGRDEAGAGRARRFLEVLRDNAGEERTAQALKALSIEQTARTVHVRWTLPSRVVLSLLAGEDPG
ncbi:MAG: hypothetical protein IT372_34820 [Polyangiaceae bacterium]|nr:hypothetical protein [Polyangiaceae bacterium]